MNAGYRVSLSHANKLAIKTDAPNEFIWRMMRELVNREPTRKADKLPQDGVTYHLRREPLPESNEEENKRYVGRTALVQSVVKNITGFFLDTSHDIHAIEISEKLSFCIFRTEFSQYRSEFCKNVI